MSRFQNIFKRGSLPFLLLLAVSNFASAQGGAAIVTLVTPPPGGDGYTALQSGGAFPTGAASLYYNPALLSGLREATGSQLHFTVSGQDVLPGWSDTRQSFTGGSAVLPDPDGRFDVGVGFFRNDLDLGRNLSSDSGADSFEADEAVYGVGASVRLASPVHLGGTVKYYDSRLAAGAAATGWAFDAGLAWLPQTNFLGGLAGESITLRPSAGLALQNLGPDAWYVTPEESDPLPTLLRTSLGARFDIADLFGISFGADWEKEVHRRAHWSDPAAQAYGTKFQVLVYQFGSGRVFDRSGNRDEQYEFKAIEINTLQLYRVFARLKAFDLESKSESFDAGYPFATVSIFGIPYRFNPRFLIGQRRISTDNGIRDGQKAWYWSLSL